ncbi:hypothetical protein RAD15_05030 [Bradyrhizobium sp. 14AA]
MHKVPITRALILRINRKLKLEQQRMRSCRRSSRWWGDLGNFYVVDLNRNAILGSHIDPETYGRELGVVHAFEKVIGGQPLPPDGRP